MNNENDPITKKDLQEVLEAVNQGFDEQTKLIKEVIQRFDEKFEGVDKRFEGVDEKFEGVDKRFEGVDKRFEIVNKRFDGVDEKAEYNKEEILASNREVLASNEKIAKSINDMRQEQIAHQGGHVRTNDTLLEHGDKLQNHEKRIIKLEPLLQSA